MDHFSNAMLVTIFVIFCLAGFIKGVIGLGLPAIAIGLLATRMPPAHAIAIVIVPAIITNIWQTFVGPYLRDILRRLWPLLAGCCVGVWSGAALGLLTGSFAPYGTIALGFLLVIYAAIALTRFQFRVARKDEKWIGGLAGVLSGLIAAATGVQVVPSMPFLQAIGMERDELIQALGVFFTTSTVAMIFNLSNAGLLGMSLILPVSIGLGAAFLGMYLGQILRERMEPETFRRWFLISLIGLGLYLAIAKMLELHII
jgi:uncharacterized membrane protein YfcA